MGRDWNSSGTRPKTTVGHSGCDYERREQRECEGGEHAMGGPERQRPGDDGEPDRGRAGECRQPQPGPGRGRPGHQATK